MILTIAGKELRRLFTSPLAWVILAFLQLILAWIFLSRLQTFLELQPQIAMTPAAPGFTEIVVAPVFVWPTPCRESPGSASWWVNRGLERPCFYNAWRNDLVVPSPSSTRGPASTECWKR